ncbi:MAG: glycosyltransferase WbuB [Microvirga sp.]|nr:glycosyltransferase WbuB [Microvirga sp.]
MENLPVPFDRRVWQEAKALQAAGWRVSVICPRTERYPAAFEEIDNIAVYRHPLPLEARGALGFVAEYSAALFYEGLLLWRVWRERGFQIIQICNPPDLLFIVAAPWKLLGKKLIFDHHDVSPELFVAKFGPRSLLLNTLKALEWLTFKSANLVISTNETFREIAIRRGGKNPEDVVTVYSVPNSSWIRRVEPRADIRARSPHILGYIGIIGDQDGVDHLIRAVDWLLREGNYRDFHAVVIGDGTALASVRALAAELEVEDYVTFTGYLTGPELLECLSTFDIGIIPDPVNDYNDKISMNKVFEYSALGVPSVAYPLSETQRLLGDAGTYAQGETPADLGRACLTLLSDAQERGVKAERAKALGENAFNWEREAGKYVAAYERLHG